MQLKNANKMRDPGVCYSPVATQELGHDRFTVHVDTFGYGNGDVTGDAGMSNGRANAWLSSSLQISPVEQADFMTWIIPGTSPVHPSAVEQPKTLTNPLSRQHIMDVLFGISGVFDGCQSIRAAAAEQ